MRAFKKLNKRGFTLVELMIVVAIIGVLAALAIYGVRRYLASAKTSEAKNTVGAISRGATAAFERETTAAQAVTEGQSSQASSHALCNNAVAVPTNVPKGKKYQPKTGEGDDFESGDTTTGWKCLKFGLTQPHYYRYSYIANANNSNNASAPCDTAPCYDAFAQGDLDGDTVTSVFSRTGAVNTQSGKLKAATQIFIANEFE